MNDKSVTDMAEASKGNGVPHARWSVTTIFVLGLILLLGIALRVRVVQYNPGLFDDDGRLGINILTKSVSELLLKPMSHNQAAPVMYLLLTKEFVEWFGSDEIVLRMPALMASVLALVVYLVLCVQTLDRWGQCFGLTLMALNTTLVQYSVREAVFK